VLRLRVMHREQKWLSSGHNLRNSPALRERVQRETDAQAIGGLQPIKPLLNNESLIFSSKQRAPERVRNDLINVRTSATSAFLREAPAKAS